MTKPINEHEGRKYLRTIYSATGIHLKDAGGACVSVDVYAVLEAFGVTCPARQHALKKLLTAGQRGKGSELDDLLGAEAAVARAIDLQRQREKIQKVHAVPSPPSTCPECHAEAASIFRNEDGLVVGCGKDRSLTVCDWAAAVLKKREGD